jgi:hypothetical protein
MSFRRKAPLSRRLRRQLPRQQPRAAPTLYFQQVNATATGIGTAAHNCFIFSGCHIATCKRQHFRAFWL